MINKFITYITGIADWRLAVGPLLAVVRAGCCLTAFVGSPDISVLLDVFTLVSN